MLRHNSEAISCRSFMSWVKKTGILRGMPLNHLGIQQLFDRVGLSN